MAETAATTRTPTKASIRSSPVVLGSNLSSGDRRVTASSAGSTTLPKASQPATHDQPSTPSPRRVMESNKTSMAPVQEQRPINNGSPAVFSSRLAASQNSPSPQRTGSAKVITPVKAQVAPLSVQRKISQCVYGILSFRTEITFT